MRKESKKPFVVCSYIFPRQRILDCGPPKKKKLFTYLLCAMVIIYSKGIGWWLVFFDSLLSGDQLCHDFWKFSHFLFLHLRFEFQFPRLFNILNFSFVIFGYWTEQPTLFVFAPLKTLWRFRTRPSLRISSPPSPPSPLGYFTYSIRTCY